ncbi:hypothetical protein AB0D57_09445 [Streptomyces sp. NPDC048275]|uniref:hypothetical protein n=1 Tax=Streptomyces sp. NPDC048275 TaxID=3155629 RepID=UPI0034098A7E
MSEHEERRGPEDQGRPEHEHKQSHAGNESVNHGPDGQPDEQGLGGLGPDGQGSGEQGSGGQSLDGQGSDGQGSDGQALDGPGSGDHGPGDHGPGDHEPGGPGPEGFGSDELALRRLLHQAVQEIEPTDGTLEHLRRAVPARRARKRQALVGMAAAALFIGTAVPALVHVSNASGSNPDPSIAGNSSQVQGGTSQGKGPDGGGSVTDGGSSASHEQGKPGSKTSTPDKGKGTSTGAATGGPAPSASAESAPACTAIQLGGVTSTVGAPDATGAVYGSFTISNVSTTSCTVSGSGAVSTAVQGAADPAKITVVSHVAGDVATGLPDPSTEVASLVLPPSASYAVEFAWVPSETCPTTGTEPSPDPTTPTDDSTTSGGTGTDTGGTGTSTQLLTDEGVADGSVTVSHTDATGAVTASTTVSNACAGTVYRTGMLSASSS